MSTKIIWKKLLCGWPDHCTANLNAFHLLLMKMEHLNTLQLNLLRNDNLQLRNLSSQKMGQVRSDKRKIDILNEEKVLTLSFLSEDCVKIWGRVRSLVGAVDYQYPEDRKQQQESHLKFVPVRYLLLPLCKDSFVSDRSS